MPRCRRILLPSPRIRVAVTWRGGFLSQGIFSQASDFASTHWSECPFPPDDQIKRDAAYECPEEAQKQGREARFRLNIVAAYNYTCALTRYRLTTITGASIVDAAHIHQFADSRNNDLRNGLALTKNAHWLFDNGLWTLGDDYRVIVAHGNFAEAG